MFGLAIITVIIQVNDCCTGVNTGVSGVLEKLNYKTMTWVHLDYRTLIIF